jgi:hypothetical protein
LLPIIVGPLSDAWMVASGRVSDRGDRLGCDRVQQPFSSGALTAGQRCRLASASANGLQSSAQALDDIRRTATKHFTIQKSSPNCGRCDAFASCYGPTKRVASRQTYGRCY